MAAATFGFTFVIPPDRLLLLMLWQADSMRAIVARKYSEAFIQSFERISGITMLLSGAATNLYLIMRFITRGKQADSFALALRWRSDSRMWMYISHLLASFMVALAWYARRLGEEGTYKPGEVNTLDEEAHIRNQSMEEAFSL